MAGVRAEQLVPVAAQALVAGLLGLRGPALDEPDGRRDEQEELQVLGLPVLRDVHDERRGGDELEVADAGFPVAGLLLVVGDQPHDRLRRQRHEEQSAEEEAEPMVGQFPHPVHRPTRPTASM